MNTAGGSARFGHANWKRIIVIVVYDFPDVVFIDMIPHIVYLLGYQLPVVIKRHTKSSSFSGAITLRRVSKVVKKKEDLK